MRKNIFIFIFLLAAWPLDGGDLYELRDVIGV